MPLVKSCPEENGFWPFVDFDQECNKARSALCQTLRPVRLRVWECVSLIPVARVKAWGLAQRRGSINVLKTQIERSVIQSTRMNKIFSRPLRSLYQHILLRC